jgi:glutathione S-transferase
MAYNEVPQVPAWGEVNRPKVEADLQQLDQRLAETPYIAGGDFTVADITAMVALNVMKPAKVLMPEGFSNLNRWRTSMLERPSTAA